MKGHRLCLGLTATLLSACFNPDIEPGRPCGDDGSCPPGQECIDMFCRLPGYVEQPDAEPPLSENANLGSLLLSVPGLQDFSPGNSMYDLHVSRLVRRLRVTAHTEDEGATLEIDGNSVANDELSQPVGVAPDVITTVDITVTAPAGNKKTYSVDVYPDGSVAQHVYGKAGNAGETNIFGWHVAIDGETMAVSATGEASCAVGVHPGGQLNSGCVDSGAVYLFHRRGSLWEPEAYLKPSNTDEGDEFGVSLALDGDTLVVGAFHEDGTLTDSGAAYVFRRDASGWNEKAYLKPTAPKAGQEFGWSVAIADNLIAVGARREDSDKGAVYLFQLNENGWTQTQQLTAPTPQQAGAFFGYSVAVGDGVVVVGACGQGCPPDSEIRNSETSGTGTAYVFRLVGTAWQQEADLASVASPGPLDGDAFGYSVALDGDTVVIGAPTKDKDSSPSEDSGAVYVFGKVANAWSQEDFLTAANTDSGDRFGSSVAIAGTLMAVGAPGEGDGNGAAYLYGRNGSTWSELKYIKASNTGINDEFGLRIALSDDALVVGAPYEDGSGTVPVHGAITEDDEGRENSGAVYLFH